MIGRLERLPMTRHQRKLFAVIASAWLVDQIDVALLTFLLGAIVREFHLSPVQVGLLASMTFAGQLVGNLAAGTASDLLGRRAVFQGTMLIWGLASFMAALSWSIGALMVFRFLIGVGVGGEAPVAQAFVSEFLPAKVRGRYIAIMEGFWAVGFVLSGTISYFLLPHFGWRWVFATVGLLAAVVFVVRRTIPESPRWLAGQGRFAEADAILTHMEDEVTLITGTTLPVAAIVPPDMSRDNPWRTLLTKPYAGRSAMAAGLWFFALLGYFGLSSWLALLLEAKGFSIVKSVGFVTLITVGGIPGFACAAWCLRKDRPQTDDHHFPCRKRRGRCGLWLHAGADALVRVGFRHAILHVRHVELPLRLHAGALSHACKGDRGGFRLRLRPRGCHRGADHRRVSRQGYWPDRRLRPGSRQFPHRRGICLLPGYRDAWPHARSHFRLNAAFIGTS